MCDRTRDPVCWLLCHRTVTMRMRHLQPQMGDELKDEEQGDHPGHATQPLGQGGERHS